MTQALRDAKDKLTAQRRASKAQARNLELELNLPAERAVDEAVRDAFASGTSRSQIAKALGESRVTVNERINRAFNGNVPVVAERPAPTPPTATPAAAEESDPTYELVGNDLLVHYRQYGPDSLTGEGRFEIIRDDDASGAYWFLALNRENTPEALLHVLDTVFNGWYYDDAVGYIDSQLDLQG